MRKKLTALILPTLPEGAYHDSGSPGLQLRVGKTRSTWSAFHRLAGKLKQTTLGHYPQMSLSDARKAAAALSDAVEAGLPVEVAQPHPRDRVLTLADVVDRFEKYRRRRAGRGAKSLDKMLLTIRSGAGRFLDLPMTAFNKAALRERRDAIAARGAPIQSNRFVTMATTMLRWAAAEDLIDSVPVVLKIGAEQSRDRVLSRDELAAVWRACGRMDDYGRFIKMLMLTAMRRGECASMRFGDILDNTLRISAERTKSARPLVLPLPKVALDLIGEGPARQSVFGPLGRFETLKRRLDKASGVTGWRLHDLRRSAATHMQNLGVPQDVISAVMNHKIDGVGSVYMRSQMEQAKREALAGWSNEVERIVAPRRHSI